jgi:AAA domain, putative AbiEii toxin, Type IV TA system/AAA domain
MRFRSARVYNYKSFLASTEMSFAAGLNVIVGPNNVGKTALLEALSLAFVRVPHRSLQTKPTPATQLAENSRVDCVFEIDASNLRALSTVEFAIMDVPANQAADSQRLLEILNRTTKVQCSVAANGEILDHPAFPDHPVPTSSGYIRCRVDDTKEQVVLAATDFHSGGSPGERLPWKLARIFRTRIYLFKAERLNVGTAPIGEDPVLTPDARNLASVLHLLQTKNPARFARFQTYVQDVFPEIKQITVAPQGGSVTILVWPIDPVTEREDLAISLAESGTGLGQVMAILYVVLTEIQPRVILIDEPHSFLHPTAIRKLLEILLGHRRHQYIITTHSPTALASSNPATLTHLTMLAGKTEAKTIDIRSAVDLRALLSSVGARLSDVFGAEKVLWVEGRTEETAFPFILDTSRRPEDRATGIVFLALRSTGDVRPKHGDAILDIYHRLTKATPLMPPAVGFILDSEGLTDTGKQDLIRQSRGTMYFLARRMFENYLLVPAAIAAVANSIQDFRPAPLVRSEIEAWLSLYKWDRKYFPTPIQERERTESVWLQTVSGAALLQDLFSELSEQRVSYDKVLHGMMLTTWLCVNEFESFAEVVTLIRRAMALEGA